MEGEVSQHRVRAGPAAGLLLATMLAAGITTLVLRRSLERGRLASLPTYDDAYYLAEGAKWLARWRTEGAWEVVREYVSRPPHSPFSTAAAGVSFAVLGIH